MPEPRTGFPSELPAPQCPMWLPGLEDNVIRRMVQRRPGWRSTEGAVLLLSVALTLIALADLSVERAAAIFFAFPLLHLAACRGAFSLRRRLLRSGRLVPLLLAPVDGHLYVEAFALIYRRALAVSLIVTVPLPAAYAADCFRKGGGPSLYYESLLTYLCLLGALLVAQTYLYWGLLRAGPAWAPVRATIVVVVYLIGLVLCAILSEVVALLPYAVIIGAFLTAARRHRSWCLEHYPEALFRYYTRLDEKGNR